MHLNYELKAKVMDTITLGDKSYDNYTDDMVVSVLDLIKLCIVRYGEYEKKLAYFIDFIEKDERIKKINFYYRTKYLNGCIFEVIFENDEDDARNYFNVFYKNGEVSYYPGVADIICSLSETEEIKKVYFEDSRYVEFFKEIGEFIQTFYCKYEFNSISNNYKVNLDIDKLILLLKNDNVSNGKYLKVIYLFDDKYIDSYYGDTIFSLGNIIYKYIGYSTSKYKKLRVVNTDIGKIYIDTNIRDIGKVLSGTLNRMIFPEGEIVGVNRFLDNIYVDRNEISEIDLKDRKVKKRVK